MGSHPLSLFVRRVWLQGMRCVPRVIRGSFLKEAATSFSQEIILAETKLQSVCDGSARMSSSGKEPTLTVGERPGRRVHADVHLIVDWDLLKADGL